MWQMQCDKCKVTNAILQMQCEKCNLIHDTFRGASWDIFQHSWDIKIQIYKISVTNKVWHVKYDKCNVGQIQYDKCYVSNLLGQMQWGK